ncbi:MAG: hypothetical protein PHQ35_10180 [Phycisphaerae bacterium]|nr:hypothetical protein [Phycisphaerae bacterium]MDD5381941.1 hypothetical protein [Phycisphaerae bacterium]
MIKQSVLILLAVSVLFAVLPVAADETIIKNDSIADTNLAVVVGDFYAGEQAGVRLTSPIDGIIVGVQILWKGDVPGDSPQKGSAIYIYAEGAFPTPGAELATIDTPLLVADGWNEFRYLDPDETVALSIPVVSGQSFYVTLEFANDTDVGSGKASVVRDTDGCQAGRNVLYAIPGGWFNLCLLGVPGDLVIRAVVESGSVCPEKLAGDINGDCYVDMLDLAVLANDWLKCNNLMDEDCS